MCNLFCNIAVERVELAMSGALPPTNQTCLTTNQIVAGFKKLLQKLEGNSRTKSVQVARFTGPRETCFVASVWRDSRVILTNQTSVFTELATT